MAARKTAAERITETRLDEDTTKPSTTAPGDGPADTTDPDERAVSAPPAGELSEEAIAVGTRNAVQPAPKPEPAAEAEGEPRIEEFTARRPDGSTVRVRRNIDTGESELVDA